MRAPLTDNIIFSLARMVDDSQTDTREPSHSDIDFIIKQAGLQMADPRNKGQIVGKAKRIRGTLGWAIENKHEAGEILVGKIIDLIRSCGGFRAELPNYVGLDAINNATDAFSKEGYELCSDGDLHPVILDSLSGKALTKALDSYVRRAKKGILDAALVTGTGKDLLEATAKHVIIERFGSIQGKLDFPTLLGQAFVAMDLATPHDSQQPGEPSCKRMERALYDLGCAINNLRNNEGTGHGRPWLTNVTKDEARIATELMGTISERLLLALKRKN